MYVVFTKKIDKIDPRLVVAYRQAQEGLKNRKKYNLGKPHVLLPMKFENQGFKKRFLMEWYQFSFALENSFS